MNLAEAQLLKKNIPAAVEALNATRTKHGGLAPSTATTEAEAWADYIRERNCEMCNEGGEIYWRYYGTDKIPGSGETQVKQVRLARAIEVDNDNNTLYIRYVTGNIPEAERGNFTESKAVVAVTISTAAIIKPIGDAPQLGVPGDWSKDNKYEVTAADGSKKTWTIVVEPYE